MKFMCLNENRDELYFVTPDLNIHYIDLNVSNNEYAISTDTLISTPTNIDHFITNHGVHILKFDNNSNRLFWLVGGRSDTENTTGKYHVRDTYLGIYNISSSGSNPSSNRIHYIFKAGVINDDTVYLKSISDVEFTTDIDSSFYLARKRHIERYEIVNNIVTRKDSIYTIPGKFGKLLYVQEIDKIFAFPFRLHYSDDWRVFETSIDTIVDIYMLDCNSYSVKRIPAPSKQITDAAYLSTYNDLVMCYSPDRFRQTTDSTDFAIYKYNAVNDTLTIVDTMLTTGFPGSSDPITLNRPVKLLKHGNTVIVSWKDELAKMSRRVTGQYEKTTLGERNKSNYYNAGVNYNSNSYVINLSYNGIYKTNGLEMLDSTVSGLPVYRSVAITDQNKVVLFNRNLSDKGKFYIHDIPTNTTIESQHLNGPIGDIIYNKEQEHLLVSENSADGKVWKFTNGGVKSGSVPLPNSEITHSFFKRMFINPDGLLFITADTYIDKSVEKEPHLLVGDATDYSSNWNEYKITMPADTSPVYFYNSDFCYNTLNNRTYITLSSGTFTDDPEGLEFALIRDPYQAEQNGMLYDPSPDKNGRLLEFYTESDTNRLDTIVRVKFPKEVFFPSSFNYADSESEGVLILNADSLFLYNLATGEKTNFDGRVFKACYSNTFNRLYYIKDEPVMGGGQHDHRQVKLTSVDLNTSTYITSSTILKGQASGLFINPLNQLLYLIIKMDEDKDGQTRMQLFEIDPTDISSYVAHNMPNRSYFPDYEYSLDSKTFFYNFITPHFEASNFTMYLPNGGHSNVSKYEFDPVDALFLGDGISWISFPRLASRDTIGRYSSLSLLNGDNITPGDYKYGLMSHFDLEEGYTTEIEFDINEDSVWYYPTFNELDSVRSNLGYKLKLQNPTQFYLLLNGDLPHSNQEVTLMEDKDSWIGYWHYETQHPLDAIPDSIQDDIYYIKAQNWQCQRSDVPDGSTPPAQNPLSCRAAQGRVELKYGDMIVVHSISNADFQWLSESSGSGDEERMAPKNFGFTEQLDYTPILVDLDTTENPQEIGVFVEDSCVGATTVWDSDTTVLVQAYMEGLSGEVTLQEYPSNKSSYWSKYLVFNKNKKQWENRPIFAQDKEVYYLISLNENNIDHDNSWGNYHGLRCYPNPSKSICYIDYYLENEQQVHLQIFDIFGNLVKTIQHGKMQEGFYHLTWHLKNSEGIKLPEGAYIVNLRTSKNVSNIKIIIAN